MRRGHGDKNGVAYAQEAHEYMLLANGLLGTDVTLRYGAAAPLTRLWEGAYVDDHVVSLRMPLKQMRCAPGLCGGCEYCDFHPENLADVKLTEALVATYDGFGAERSMGKGSRSESSFIAWGSHTDGVAGKVGVALDKRQQVSRLIFAMLRVGHCSKSMLQSLAGTIVHSFLHKRCNMSSLSEVYRFIESMPSEGDASISAVVVDELLAVILLLGSSYAKIRAPVSSHVSVTDATPSRAGRCRCVIPNRLARVLYRRGNKKVNMVVYAGRMWSWMPQPPA